MASIPDNSTFWRFRQQLEKRALMEPLLKEINDQFIEQSLYIKSGSVSPTRPRVVVQLRTRVLTGMSKQVLTESVKAPMVLKLT
jgi:IS5 family transposase